MVSRKKLIKAILIHRAWKQRKRKRRSQYIRPLFLNRQVRGETFLISEMREEDPYYHNRYFRMNSESFDEILETIRSRITHSTNHARPISALQRLAVTLRYLTSGNSQVTLAMSYRISPSSISNILRETMKAICQELGDEYLPPPTKDIWIANEKDFSKIWNFPNGCGALDGKHIRSVSPNNSSSHFYNYKNYFSTVLLAIANAKYVFTAVDIGAAGSESDGGILMRSAIGKCLLTDFYLPADKKITNDGPLLPYVILGDDGFPLKPYLMRPFKGKWRNKSDKIFNYRLSRARMVVENAFGILAARFRIFRTMIDADLDLVNLITLSSVILHNFLMSKKDFSNITPDREEEGEVIPGSWREEVENDQGLTNIPTQGSQNSTKNSQEIREQFKAYFLSDEGKLIWQDAHVTRDF